MRQATHCLLISVFVGILESRIVYCLPHRLIFDNFPLYNTFWNRENLFISYTCEYLVRFALFQSNKSNPFFFIYIKSYHITVEYFRTFWSFRTNICFTCNKNTVS